MGFLTRFFGTSAPASNAMKDLIMKHTSTNEVSAAIIENALSLIALIVFSILNSVYHSIRVLERIKIILHAVNRVMYNLVCTLCGIHPCILHHIIR
jgi:hypothetical protein